MATAAEPAADDPKLAGSARSAWRVAALTELERLEAELARIPAELHESPDFGLAERSLENARRALEPYGMRSWPLLVYSGARVEEAWGALHETRRCLIGLIDEDGFKARLPSLRDAVTLQFEKDDPERARALKTLDEIAEARRVSELDRERARGILVQADTRSDTYWREGRVFRNALLVFSGVLLVVVAVLAVMHFFDSSLISVCAPASPSLGTDLCPGGGATPGRFDVIEVELIGALGGLLAAIVPLRNARRLPGPYGLSIAQGLLKVTGGAATALAGVLLLQGGALAGLDPQPGSNVLAYAALFGIAQQALTTWVDRRVSDMSTAQEERQAKSTG